MRLKARIEAVERHLRLTAPGALPHPLPDLTAASPMAIAEAMLNAMCEAHASEAGWPSTAEIEAGRLTCPSCLATVDASDRYANPGPGPSAGPNPLALALEELMERLGASAASDEDRTATR